MIVSYGAFGIEFDWLLGEGEPALTYCFRAGQRTIGTLGLPRSFQAASADLAQLLRHEGNRRNDAWLEKPPERLLAELQAALIVDFDAGIDPGPHWHQTLRFLALPLQSPTFLGWSGFLVEGGDTARLIWTKNERRNVVFEERLALGDFEAALKELHALLEQPASRQSTVPPHSGERVIGGAQPSIGRKAAT